MKKILKNGIRLLAVITVSWLAYACTAPIYHQSDVQKLVVAANARDAYLHYQGHRFEKARLLLMQRAGQTTKSEIREIYAKLLSHLGYNLNKKGHSLLAATYFETALTLQTAPWGQAINLNNLYHIYHVIGDYDQAKISLEKALRIADQADTLESVAIKATTLGNLAGYYMERRNYNQAVGYLDQALEIAHSRDLPKTEVNLLSTYGAIYRQQGDFDQALNYYQQAYHRSQKANLTKSMALVERILGELTLYRPEKDFDKAQKYLRSALDKHVELGESLNAALATAHLGEVAFKKGDYHKAIELSKTALHAFRKHGYQDGIGRANYHLGYVYGRIDKLETAIDHFDAAFEIYNRINDKEWKWRSLFGRGLMRERQYQRNKSESVLETETRKQLNLIMEDYRHAIREFESIRKVVYGGETAEDLFSAVNSKLYENFISLLVEEKENEEALDLVRRSRSQEIKNNLLLDSGTDAACHHLLMQFAELSHRQADLQRHNANLLASSESNDEVRKRLAEKSRGIRQALYQADDLLKMQYPELYTTFSGKADPTVRSTEVKKIPRDHAILYLIPLQNRVAILVQQSGRPIQIKLSSEKLEVIDDKIRRFRRLIQVSRFSMVNQRNLYTLLPESDDYYSKLIHVSMELYDTLLGQVMPMLYGVKTLGLFSAGNLSYLPYGALCRSYKGKIRFLVQDYRIYQTNGKVYDRLASKIQWSDAQIAAFVNPDVNDPAYDLPETQALAERVLGQASRHAKLFARDEATKYNLRNIWQTSQILHIGAHGVLTTKNPFLQLSPKATGRLSACEITGWPRPANLKLIVLSACETAVGLTESGSLTAPLDQANLQIAFSSRGVSDVIASLWKVSEKGSSQLFDYFYKELQNDITPLEAINLAQKKLIDTNSKYNHPFYWAAFRVYVGF